MLTKALKSFFSIKVPIQSIKKLREQTSAPMGECRKALQQSQGDHQQAIQWLKNKGLSTALKHSNKQTREGVIASFTTPCQTKAMLLQVNCQTDFVAKNELFLKFVNGLGNRLLEAESPVNVEGSTSQDTKSRFQDILEKMQPINIFPEDNTTKNMGQQLKVVISRLGQNIRIRRAVTLQQQNCLYGSYVHMPYTSNIGLQACVVQIQPQVPVQGQENAEIINQFANDMAIQILGNPPKYYNFTQIPEEIIQEQTQKVNTEVAGILSKAPQHTHENIIAGKLMSNFYSKTLLACMPYVLSNEGRQVSEYWMQVEADVGSDIKVRKSYSWGCK